MKLKPRETLRVVLDIRSGEDEWKPRNKVPLQGNMIYDEYRLYDLVRIFWDSSACNRCIPFEEVLMTPEQATAYSYLTCEPRGPVQTFHGVKIRVENVKTT